MSVSSIRSVRKLCAKQTRSVRRLRHEERLAERNAASPVAMKDPSGRSLVDEVVQKPIVMLDGASIIPDDASVRNSYP
jgi:hypothetical protein